MQTILAHFEYTDLIRGTETVFYATQDTIGSMPVSLEIKHRIYHMFQHARSCNNALFCHMSYNKYRYVHPLCNLHQCPRGFAHLGDAPRCRGYGLVIHGLYGIYDHDLRLFFFYDLMDRIQICLAEQRQAFRKFPDAFRTDLDLLQRLLSRYIEYPLTLSGKIFAHLQKQG